MNILFINGSPNKAGNTAALAAELLVIQSGGEMRHGRSMDLLKPMILLVRP